MNLLGLLSGPVVGVVVTRWWMASRLRSKWFPRQRCTHCGRPFEQGDGRHSFGNRDGRVYHEPCIGYLIWRRKAAERLEVLDLVCEIWEVNDRDVTGAFELRAQGEDQRVEWSNLAFRVMYDLKQVRTQRAESAS
jgi:hypothetical protein